MRHLVLILILLALALSAFGAVWELPGDDYPIPYCQRAGLC